MTTSKGDLVFLALLSFVLLGAVLRKLDEVRDDLISIEAGIGYIASKPPVVIATKGPSRGLNGCGVTPRRENVSTEN